MDFYGCLGYDFEMADDATKETEQRLRAVLSGAFKGSPTPLKAIPKKGKEPSAKKNKHPR
jgi:hypothetical protein